MTSWLITKYKKYKISSLGICSDNEVSLEYYPEYNSTETVKSIYGHRLRSVHIYKYIPYKNYDMIKPLCEDGFIFAINNYKENDKWCTQILPINTKKEIAYNDMGIVEKIDNMFLK